MLHVMHGEDDFSAREALTKLLHEPRFAYNIDRFDGPAAEMAAIRQACGTMPFLSEGRLVVVEGLPKPRKSSAGDDAAPAEAPAKGAKGKRGAKKPSAAAQARDFVGALAELGTDLPETTTLVIFVPEELPKTSPLLAAAEKHGKLHTFAPPTGAALDRWIAQRVKHENATLTPDAARNLADLAHGDLRLLANEIAKLATYTGPGGTIDAATVALLVPDSREARVFDLTDALGRGERSPALRLLHELLADGQAPLMIVGLVAGQVRRLTQVKDLAARGMRPPEIASQAGMAPFVVSRTLEQARRFTLAQLEAAQRACLEVDTALKRSRMSPELALDLLLAEFGRA